MHCVTLIATVHQEMGNANASKLTRILETICPDAIFMEMPTDAFDQSFQVFRRPNLESNSITEYRKNNRAALLPVDLPTPKESFFLNLTRLNTALKAKSTRYRELLKRDESRIRTCGLAYLNSEHCDRHWESVYSVMYSETKALNDPKLTEILLAWIDHNERREGAMLNNIDRYCLQYAFDNPAFLVGAAHRRQFISRSTGEGRPHEAKIEWLFPRL